MQIQKSRKGKAAAKQAQTQNLRSGKDAKPNSSHLISSPLQNSMINRNAGYSSPYKAR